MTDNLSLQQYIHSNKSWKILEQIVSRDKFSQLHDNSIVIIHTWKRPALYRTAPPLSEWNSSFCTEVFTSSGVGLASKSCMRGWKANRSCSALLRQSISPAVLFILVAGVNLTSPSPIISGLAAIPGKLKESLTLIFLPVQCNQ